MERWLPRRRRRRNKRNGQKRLQKIAIGQMLTIWSARGRLFIRAWRQRRQSYDLLCVWNMFRRMLRSIWLEAIGCPRISRSDAVWTDRCIDCSENGRKSKIKLKSTARITISILSMVLVCTASATNRSPFHLLLALTRSLLCRTFYFIF